MQTRWLSEVLGHVRRLVYPPRCRVCAELLEWPPPLEARDQLSMVSRFHHELSGVMCPTCRQDVSIPVGQRCTACGIPLQGAVIDPPLCGICMSPERKVHGVTALFLHEGGPAHAVRRLKYRNKRALAPPMGRLLYAVGREVHGVGGQWTIDIVAPVPLHVSRLRKRGFNQASLLVRSFEHETGLRVAHRLLRRKKVTQSQAGLSRKGRLRNVQGAFGLVAGETVKGKHVLLVDDVLTTGATIQACAAALSRAGAARVSVLVFSRKDRR